MIKNPKLGQKVFFLDDADNICEGKISQVYISPSVGINNSTYRDKKYAFPTKVQALKYLQIKADLEYANHVASHWEKQKKKIQTKLDALLK